MNDSSTGGYLVPGGAPLPVPLQDAALDKFLHDVLVGLSGLDGTEVRPRWQPEPPNIETFGVNWMSFGVSRFAADAYAYLEHDSDGEGSDTLQRHETLEILLSSYGDDAVSILSQVRDGIQISQNLAVLESVGMGFLETGEIISVPSLVKDRWLRKYDMNLSLRRQVRRVYPILTLRSAQGVIINDVSSPQERVTPFTVNGP